MILQKLNDKMPQIRKNIVFGILVLLVFISSFFSGEWSDWLMSVIFILVFLLLLYSVILYKDKQSYFDNWKSRYLYNPNTYLLLLSLIVIISCFFSINKFKSFNLFFLFLAYASVYYAATKYFDKWARISIFIRIIFYNGVLVSLISLGMFFFQSSTRASGLLFNANALGSYLLFSLPIGLIYLFNVTENKKLKVFDIIGLMIIISAFILTLSYTGFVSFVIPFFILLYYFRKKIFQKKNIKYYIVITLVILVALFIIRFQKLGEATEAIQIYKTISLDHISFSFNQRFDFDLTAINIFLDNIWNGSGYNTFQSIFGRYSQTVSEQPRYVHNYYLQMLAEIGILGFLFLVSFIILILYKAKKLFNKEPDLNKKNTYLAIFLGLLGSSIHTAFDFGWQFPAVFVLFWTFAGLVVAISSGNGFLETIKEKIKINKVKKFIVTSVIVIVSLLLFGRGITVFISNYYSQLASKAEFNGDLEEQWNFLEQANKFNPDPNKIVDYVQVRTKFNFLNKDEDYADLENKMKALIN
ncbi:MAG: O-antigen ligase family protein, partial [bacterium]|nr:O-antigen ligase family protein [bacterium]